MLTGLAVAPCVALVPSVVKGESRLSIYSRYLYSHSLRFRPGQELGRGDLSLFTAGWPVRNVTYSLDFICREPWSDVPFRIPISPARWIRIGNERVPISPAPGEYYPALRIPPDAFPGEYQIRWKVRLENGEVREPVQPFWVGGSAPPVDDYEYLRKALFRSLKMPKKYVAMRGVGCS
jgi:hypothetical protein